MNLRSSDTHEIDWYKKIDAYLLILIFSSWCNARLAPQGQVIGFH